MLKVCVNKVLKRANAKNGTLKDAKSSFTLNESERESDFVSLIFVGAQCEHWIYEPIWKRCHFGFRCNINEP